MKIIKKRTDGVIQTYNVKPTHEKKYMKQINQTIAKSLDKQRKELGEQIKYQKYKKTKTLLQTKKKQYSKN